jgi:hypothetical protein
MNHVKTSECIAWHLKQRFQYVFNTFLSRFQTEVGIAAAIHLKKFVMAQAKGTNKKSPKTPSAGEDKDKALPLPVISMSCTFGIWEEKHNVSLLYMLLFRIPMDLSIVFL